MGTGKRSEAAFVVEKHSMKASMIICGIASSASLILPGLPNRASPNRASENIIEKISKNGSKGILDYYSEMYFVEKLAFSIMGNHFHLVIKSEPEHLFDDREVTRRYVRFILKEKNPTHNLPVPITSPSPLKKFSII